MNYAEWLEKAKDEINKLKIGATFQISELFQSYEWNKLSAKERQSFGRYFSTAFNDGQIPMIIRFEPDKKGPNKYKKENKK